MICAGIDEKTHRSDEEESEQEEREANDSDEELAILTRPLEPIVYEYESAFQTAELQRQESALLARARYMIP